MEVAHLLLALAGHATFDTRHGDYLAGHPGVHLSSAWSWPGPVQSERLARDNLPTRENIGPDYEITEVIDYVDRNLENYLNRIDSEGF